MGKSALRHSTSRTEKWIQKKKKKNKKPLIINFMNGNKNKIKNNNHKIHVNSGTNWLENEKNNSITIYIYYSMLI